jgi:oxygen-independent coproporphyrinogen-3 oxidase
VQKSTAIQPSDQRTPNTISLGQAPPPPHLTPRGIFHGLKDTPEADFRRPRSLYIHTPFCVHKCHYCDFYSIVDQQDRQAAFTARLERELAALAPFAGPLDTIFVGGGTPSLLRVDLWRSLLRTLAERYDLSAMKSGVGEFTVECNPESVTRELLDTLVAEGVTRVSVGAQSFHAAHLKTLERRHDPAGVLRAIETARAAGIRRQNVDLIFGVPGQTLDEWRADLEHTIAMGTDHVSCYNLTYEPNTAMTARLARGEFEKADEDVEVDMYHATLSTLRAAGLDRYEVSNYAKPGAECRHNLAYWRQEPWLAAGPSASAHVAGHRWKNVPRLDDYLSIDDAGFAPMMDHEAPDEMRALREHLMTGVRLREGVSSAEMLKRAQQLCGDVRASRLNQIASAMVAKGWMQPTPERWMLTDVGFLFADSVAADMMECVESP